MKRKRGLIRYRVLTTVDGFLGYVWLPKEIDDDALVNAFRVDRDGRDRLLVPGRLVAIHPDEDRLWFTWADKQGTEWMVDLIKAEESEEPEDWRNNR